MRIYQPAEGADRLPQAMIEASTEYDWAELPDWLQEVMRHAADEFRLWADAEPVKIDRALKFYMAGEPLDWICATTGIPKARLDHARKWRHIPERPPREDGAK